MKKNIILFSIIMLSSLALANVEFDFGNKKYNYNPDELKFYEGERQLEKAEIQNLFPDYEIILISDFNKKREYEIENSSFNAKKVLLLNDTYRTFHGFYIFPESARKNEISKEIKSLITIWGKKDVHLKHEGGDKFEINVK